MLWNEVDTWTNRKTGYAELDMTKAVIAGEKYRIVVICTVWSGSDSETQPLKSGSMIKTDKFRCLKRKGTVSSMGYD